MAGFSELYCIGGAGGFSGADGVNPILLQILVGDASRQWLEPHYFTNDIAPLGGIRRMIPDRPNAKNMLLDACILFYPDHFTRCKSLAAVAQGLGMADMLDFDRDGEPAGWSQLRQEAEPFFKDLVIWRARLERMPRSTMNNPNVGLPFFAYGLFKPGQLGFLQIKDFVEDVTAAKIDGVLKERDGVPLLVTSPDAIVRGSLIYFRPPQAGNAYGVINELEEKLFRWQEISVKAEGGLSHKANVLIGTSPDKGSRDIEHADAWDGQNDPLFTSGLDVCQEILDANERT